MAERVPLWFSLLLAVVALISSALGAFIGGRVANQGQQKQFENERVAHAQDLLEAEYSNYLGSAQAVVTDRNLARKAERLGNRAQALRNHAKEQVDFVRFRAADAQVRLVGSKTVLRDANAVRDAVAGGPGTLHWVAARRKFIHDARVQVRAGRFG